MKFIFILACVLPILDSKFVHRFIKVECGASLKTVVDPYCFMKFRKGKFVISQLLLSNFIKNSFQLFYEFSHKNDEAYEVISQQPKIELCKLLKGIEANAFFNNMLDVIKVVGKGVVAACTTTGDIKTFNASITDSPFMRRWPTGDYKTTFRLFDEIDDNILNATIFSTINH